MPWATKWSTKQKDALAYTYVDLKVTPAQRVADLAAAGKIIFDGETLPAFDAPASTVRDAGRHLRKRRAGELKTASARLPPRDAIEALRQRLVVVADQELAQLEGKKRGSVDLERLRQITRCVREAAALPGPQDPRPVAPGQKIPGAGNVKNGSTSSGLAGSIIAATQPTRVSTQAKGTPEAPRTTRPAAQSEQEHRAEQSAHTPQSTEQEEEGLPGSWASEQVRALAGSTPERG